MKNKITLTLPDNSTRMYPTGTTLLEVAESIGTRLAKDAVAAQINGNLTDLTEAIDIDADINIITGDSADGHEVL